MTSDTNNDSGELRSRRSEGFPIALTRDEFEQRFSERVEIFSMAMSLDTADVLSAPLTRDRNKLKDEVLDRVAELVNKEVKRILDLVYDETL